MVMNDGIITRSSHLNTGSLSTTAEELAQKHQKLFQDFSRLKAQHAVLKKAIIKEQSTNATLQSNVKEKEKDLRRLQEQLDLMTFHNEQLTKRIRTVQEETGTKGPHFSLLGGSLKKELDKSSQALEVASLDLENKIRENERLHEELSDVNHIYTDNIKKMYEQITECEKRIEELENENAILLNQSHSTDMVLAKEKSELEVLVERLEQDLAEKTRSLQSYQSGSSEGTGDLQELRSLRAILLAKAGNVERSSHEQETPLPTLADIVPLSNALKELEELTMDYVRSLRGQAPVTGLPHEIAQKLEMSSKTWSDEVQSVVNQLRDAEGSLVSLRAEKEKMAQTSADYAEQVSALNGKVAQLEQELSRQGPEETIQQLQEANNQLVKERDVDRAQVEQLETVNGEMAKKLSALEMQYTDLQISISCQKDQVENKTSLQESTLSPYQEAPIVSDSRETQTETAVDAPSHLPDNGKDDENETFVYPHDTGKDEDDNEEDDDSHFVYRGKDAPPETKPTPPRSSSISHLQNDIKDFYESQLEQMTDLLQTADSKALRYADMTTMLKTKLANEVEEKQMMRQEIERLQKELVKVQELLQTTEKNYQGQLDTLTEHISELQSMRFPAQ